MERHSRTRLLAENFVSSERVRFDVPIVVELEAQWASHPDAQLTFLTTVNMLARVTERLAIVAPAGVPLRAWAPWGAASDVLERAREIRAPFATQPEAGPEPAAVVRVGTTPREGPCILVSSRGFAGFAFRIPGAQKVPPAFADPNPMGALVAASLGAAQAYVEVLRSMGATRLPDYDDETVWNALTHRAEPDPVDAPAWAALSFGPERVILVGAGAVGHGVVFATCALGARGGLAIIDGGDLKDSNLNRYLLIGPPDPQVGKAKRLGAAPAPPGLELSAADGDYATWRAANPQPIGLAISTVDNSNWNAARKDLQTDLPRNLIHAATGLDTLTVGNIRFLQGPCLGCLTPEAGESEDPAMLISKQTDIDIERCRQLFYEEAPLQEADLRKLAEAMGRPYNEVAHLLGQPGSVALGRDLCGIHDIPTPQGTAQASVSFLSGLAGFLAAFEALKVTTPALRPWAQWDSIRIPTWLPAKSDREIVKRGRTCSVVCTHPVLQQAWRDRWPGIDEGAPLPKETEEREPP